jgi:hypothetical protein
MKTTPSKAAKATKLESKMAGMILYALGGREVGLRLDRRNWA